MELKIINQSIKKFAQTRHPTLQSWFQNFALALALLVAVI